MGQPELQFRRNERASFRSGSINDLFLDAWGNVTNAFLSMGVSGWGPTVPFVTDPYSSTITFDLDRKPTHFTVLSGNATLAVANVSIGQQFTIILQQDGTGSYTVTWFSTIRWPAGTVPTLTTTSGQIDVFTFKCIATGSYLGFVAGQNM